jgi:hypothetical protein
LEQARKGLPYFAFVAVLGLAAAGLRVWQRGRTRRPARRAPSWAGSAFGRLVRLGRDADVEYAPGQTVREYAHAVAVRLGEPQVAAVGATIDTDAWSAHGVDPRTRAEAEEALARVERAARARGSARRRSRVVRSLGGSEPR